MSTRDSRKAEAASKYLVHAIEGPSFTTVEEMIPLLENDVLPGLDAVTDVEAKKTILAGGLPVGERALVFVVETPSNEELDGMLRKIPMWGLLTWEVTPLRSFKARADHERASVTKAKKKGMR